MLFLIPTPEQLEEHKKDEGSLFLPSTELVAELNKDEEAPWKENKEGKTMELTTTRLAALLKKYRPAVGTTESGKYTSPRLLGRRAGKRNRKVCEGGGLTMRGVGFDKTTRAPVHIALSAFIYAASRCARVRETEQGKRPTCAPRRPSVYAASRVKCTSARVETSKPTPRKRGTEKPAL